MFEYVIGATCAKDGKPTRYASLDLVARPAKRRETRGFLGFGAWFALFHFLSPGTLRTCVRRRGGPSAVGRGPTLVRRQASQAQLLLQEDAPAGATRVLRGAAAVRAGRVSQRAGSGGSAARKVAARGRATLIVQAGAGATISA